MSSDAYNHCLEYICQLGCDSVRRIILELRRGRVVSEAVKLSEDERQKLLLELQDIMAVYDERDPEA